MYGLIATRKNARNNYFSVSKMKKMKLASHYSLSFSPILLPRHFLEMIMWVQPEIEFYFHKWIPNVLFLLVFFRFLILLLAAAPSASHLAHSYVTEKPQVGEIDDWNCVVHCDADHFANSIQFSQEAWRASRSECHKVKAPNTGEYRVTIAHDDFLFNYCALIYTLTHRAKMFSISGGQEL